MEMRDRLIELLKVPIYPHLDADPAEVVADYLLANGVIVPPCKVGDAVYVIYDNKVIKGKADALDIVVEEGSTEYVVGAKFFCQISMCKGFAFGRNVFLTKEDAEAKLKEMNGNG